MALVTWNLWEDFLYTPLVTSCVDLPKELRSMNLWIGAEQLKHGLNWRTGNLVWVLHDKMEEPLQDNIGNV
jgi:hypothetical protein